MPAHPWNHGKRCSPRHGSRLGGAAGTLLALLLAAAPARAADIEAIELHPERGGISVTAELTGGFGPEIVTRLQSGLEISFEYTVQLRRRRSRFLDKTVSERYVVVTVQYSNLTKMYKLTRRVDATVTDSELTDRSQVMRAWMTRLDRLPLFEPRDLDAAGTYYVRVKASLLSRFRMLFIPWDLETGWAESTRLRLDDEGRVRGGGVPAGEPAAGP